MILEIRGRREERGETNRRAAKNAEENAEACCDLDNFNLFLCVSSALSAALRLTSIYLTSISKGEVCYAHTISSAQPHRGRCKGKR